MNPTKLLGVILRPEFGFGIYYEWDWKFLHITLPLVSIFLWFRGGKIGVDFSNQLTSQKKVF